MSDDFIPKQHFPGLYQIIESAWDFPTAINLSDRMVWTPPTVYYKTDVIQSVIYNLYCFFWIKDTNHPFDFTGFIIKDNWQRYARNHFDFKPFDGAPCYSAGDHNLCEPEDDATCIFYQRDVDYVDMRHPNFEKAASQFLGDGATHPREWMSPRIRKAGLIWHDPAEFFRIMDGGRP